MDADGARRSSRPSPPIAALQPEIARAPRHLEGLFDISKLLLRFQSVEQTVPDVVAAVSAVVPLCSALSILASAEPRLVAWRTDGAPTELLVGALRHAQSACDYLVPTPLALCLDRATHRTLPALPSLAAAVEPPLRRGFVFLPLAVGGGPTFGALQFESARPMQEGDLFFLNAVVNQLAISLDRDHGDRALRASEGQLAAIIAIAADAVISTDAAQRIVMYNEGAEKIFGWTRAEALGKPLEILIPARLRVRHHGHVRMLGEGPDSAQKMAAGRPDVVGMRKGGEEFPIDAAISKLQVGGTLVFTAILRDITEQKRAERDDAFLAEVSTVLASTLDCDLTLHNVASLTLRSGGDFCFVEFVDDRDDLHSLEALSSDPAKAEILRELKELQTGRRAPRLNLAVLQARRAAMMAGVSAEALRAIAPSAAQSRLLSSLAPTSMIGARLMLRGRLLGALVVASCQEEFRYTERDQRLLVALGQHAALAFESARLYRLSRRAVRARDDVLGVVAHDLRNPLHVVLLQARLLRATLGGAVLRPVEAIERAGKRMDRLIADLLDVARLEAGHLSVNCASIAPSCPILEAVASLKPLTTSRSLELRLDVAADLPQVWADKDRILQVLENLIGNAIKFTGPGGCVTVGAVARDDDVLFSVSDTGEGIAAEDLPHLFDRFWQSRENSPSGAGLGLAIVNGLVEAHRGRTSVESTKGVGSTFHFTIPVHGPESPSNAAPT